MRQSKLFTKTRKEAPNDEVSKNAQLLIRAGYVHKEMAGVYSFLPLGLKVLKNIENIIREEMNDVDGQEVFLPTLQEKTLWQKTDRWDDEKVDIWFKTKLKNESELGLGMTHEEPVTQIFSEYISSYKDLPKAAYQIQNKFRNELRSKSGLMRGREFMMKDMYTFCRTQEEQNEFYERVKGAYKKIFERAGLKKFTYVTYASGGMFSKFSEEFQALSDSGEDLIYVDEKKGIALNKEVLNDEVINELGLTRENLIEKKAIEIGNIFHLGTRFSEPLGLTFKDAEGNSKPVIMGTYGLGLSRLMGTIVEVLSDDKGIVWPESVAPFKAHLVLVSTDDEGAKKLADEICEYSKDDVLYDDREGVRAGEKFTDADLIGIPWQIIVGKKTTDNEIELKNRKTGEMVMKTKSEIKEMICQK